MAPVQQAARAAIFYVGSDPTCDTSTLSGAVGAAAFTISEDDEIRIVNMGAQPSQELRNFNPSTIGALTISGGWADCNGTTSPSRDFVQGDGSGPATLRIVSDGAASHVTLRHLEITTNSGQPIRGVTVSGAQARLHLENTRIRDHFGGGLAAESGALVSIDEQSEISENGVVPLPVTAPGAGIACSGARIESAGNVTSNHTSSSGGGIFLDGGCEYVAQAGTYIGGNSATWGGGLALSAGASFEVDDGATVLRIIGNSAELEGGGIYALNADVTLRNTEVISNTAGQRGAGVFADLGSDVLMTSSVPCFGTFGCSKVSFNSIDVETSFREGTAIYAGGGASVALFQSRVEHNTNLNRRGHPIFVTDPGTLLLLEGATVYGNDAESLFRAEDGAEITAAFVSAANNQWIDGSGERPPFGAVVAGAATVGIYSSILSGHSAFDVETGSSLGLDCAIVNTGTGSTSVRAVLVGIDPLFFDPESNDLHLQATSPAIDYCDAATYAPLIARDLDDLPRGVDVAVVPDILGTYDLGAYEQIQQPIFHDNYESADTAAWSSTLP